MGEKAAHAPKIFHVNWFRTDDDGNFIWPGFGDNFRVLLWILDRCAGKAGAVDSAIGYLPKPEDIDTEGLDISADTMKELLTVDTESWIADLDSIKAFYAKIGDTMPKGLLDELATLEANLKK